MSIHRFTERRKATIAERLQEGQKEGWRKVGKTGSGKPVLHTALSKRATVIWTRSAKHHQGPRHATSRSIRGRTHVSTPPARQAEKRFSLQKPGRPHMCRQCASGNMAPKRPFPLSCQRIILLIQNRKHGLNRRLGGFFKFIYVLPSVKVQRHVLPHKNQRQE